MNKTIFTGRLTKEPELRRTGEGTAVLSASIAVDDGWGDKKRTAFPDLVLWSYNAEYIAKYAHKGDLVEVAAKYRERKYTDRDGQNRTAKEFEVDEVHILSSRSKDAQAAPQGFPAGDFAEVTDAEGDDRLPF